MLMYAQRPECYYMLDLDQDQRFGIVLCTKSSLEGVLNKSRNVMMHKGM